MKKIAACSLIAATAALLSLATPAVAGVLTLDDGSPTYTPPGDFTNNTIVADTIIVGGLIHLAGDVTVTPDASNVAMVEITGTYSAEMGEIFSVAYKFAADLNTEIPVTFTLSGTVSGVPIPPIDGTIEPGLHVYEGTAAMPFPFPGHVSGDFSGTLTLNFAASGNQPAVAAPGSLDLSVQQIDFKLDVLPATVLPPAQSQNISTRANVGTGDDVLIGGIIITGTDTKQVVLRAIGPSLSGMDVTGALADPSLELFDSSGALLASNDNWKDNSAADQTILNDAMLAPTEDAESALVANLDPGAYTAIVRGVDDTTGVALVEAYDLDNGATDSKFGNISTRGMVGTGENVMIGGFILGGGGGGFAQVIVRGIGPSLADFGLTNVLADPTLELFDENGTSVASNDNWMDDPNMQTVADRDLAPTDPNESAIYEVLPIGSYTAILSGVGDTTGIGLVESYDVDIGAAGTPGR
jgi:hypothetical protein